MVLTRPWSRTIHLSASTALLPPAHALMRQALERGSISLGRAAEILDLERGNMRRLAGEWAK